MKKTCRIDDCARPVLARGLCPSHYSTWWREHGPKQDIVCTWCGATARVSRKKAIYCSLTCCAKANQAMASCASNQARHRAAIERRLPVVYTGPIIPRQAPITLLYPKNRRRRLTAGYCVICSTSYVSYFPLDVTCSATCQEIHARTVKKTGKDRRRARERGAYIEDVSRKRVFERDGYRCHLCGRKTLKGKRAPHPRSPSLDHVIPLAKGGRHESINCRCACFLCNSRKGDRGGGEQLLLIGA